MVPSRDDQHIFFVLKSYEKKYLLVSIFNIGDIFLVKEYLVAVRFADMKEITSAINVL